MTGEEPDKDAYGRVTNAARYQAVVDGVDDLLARLEQRYVVTRLAQDDPRVPPLTAPDRVKRVTHLEPEGGGAPVTVGFTGFPGVYVRYGRWEEDAYPHCGCDACDEDPDELLEEIADRLDAITGGSFGEAVEQGRVRHWWSTANGSGGGDRMAAEGEDLPATARLDWPAWLTREARP